MHSVPRALITQPRCCLAAPCSSPEGLTAGSLWPPQSSTIRRWLPGVPPAHSTPGALITPPRRCPTAKCWSRGALTPAAANASGSTNYLASVELYDVGLGFLGAWQPQISSASFDVAGKLMLTGTGLRGISSASGGNGGQDSPTNHPVVQLRRLDNEQSVFLLPDPAQ